MLGVELGRAGAPWDEWGFVERSAPCLDAPGTREQVSRCQSKLGLPRKRVGGVGGKREKDIWEALTIKKKGRESVG